MGVNKIKLIKPLRDFFSEDYIKSLISHMRSGDVIDYSYTSGDIKCFGLILLMFPNIEALKFNNTHYSEMSIWGTGTAISICADRMEKEIIMIIKRCCMNKIVIKQVILDQKWDIKFDVNLLVYERNLQ